MEFTKAIDQWAEDSLNSKALRPRSLAGYVYSLKLIARHGVADTSALTREFLAAFFLERRLQHEVSSQTCRRALAAVCSLLLWLEERGEFPMDEIDDIRRLWTRLPTPAPLPPRFLTRPEFSRLLETAADVHPMIELALFVAVHTGLRLGELRGLHVEDLRLADTPYVRVIRDLERENKSSRERTVPVCAAFADDMRKRRLPSSGPLFPARPGGRGQRTNSRYIADPTVRRWLWIARAAAGLGRDVNFVTCRHTFASWLVQANVSIAKVARWLGHSGLNVCYRHYAGLIPGGDAEVDRGFSAA